MTKLYLDTSALSAKADELERLNETFLQEVGVLNDNEEILAGMWEGPAKESFRNAYHRDSVQMKNFYNAIKIYVVQLRAIIEAYKRIEQLNNELARQRKYCSR